jgi:hypothetical protein
MINNRMETIKKECDVNLQEENIYTEMKHRSSTRH